MPEPVQVENTSKLKKQAGKAEGETTAGAGRKVQGLWGSRGWFKNKGLQCRFVEYATEGKTKP